MKICVVTGTRAEYGLLKPLMEKIKTQEGFILQVAVTGAHLSEEFGLTYRQIEADGFQIDYKVDMKLTDDSAQGITKSMGFAMIGFSDCFAALSPDMIFILGDRYEMLSVAAAALIFKIPIAHIHGGEITEGAFDDAIRHAITKMSHLHFASTEEYRKRIIQLGENPKNTFNVGAIGLDNIKNLIFLSKSELEQDLGIQFKKYNYQVTFHPETLADQSAEEQFEILLNAIRKEEDSFFIFTKANADTNGRIINLMIEEFVRNNPNISAVFPSLGTLKFLSLVKVCDAIIGNSSAGILEAPFLETTTINIGDRQKGRIFPESVINVSFDSQKISLAIQKSKDRGFQQIDSSVYGNGTASEQIINRLKTVNLTKILQKKFFDRR